MFYYFMPNVDLIKVSDFVLLHAKRWYIKNVSDFALLHGKRRSYRYVTDFEQMHVKYCSVNIFLILYYCMPTMIS